MCVKNWCAAVLLCWAEVCACQTPLVTTTTLAAQTENNTSTATTFTLQSNGNIGANNISKLDVHTLLSGATTKIYAHLLLWFGESSHMNVGYSSTDPAQIHRQITDMISRGIDGVIIDWYGPNNSIDQATQLVMAEAETHPGFTFAIMVDQGAIKWDSCSGCSPQQALISQLQYIEQTYLPSRAYMTLQGKPMVTNFNIDQSYSINWDEVSQALSTQPAFVFQNNDGFTHVLSEGSYSWVMPTTTDYGMSYLTSFYDTGMPLQTQETIGASYKGFNDTLASWGSDRIMGQQCGQTWLQTFSKINSLYHAGTQLEALQLVTWNDYEEATEIESGIDNCVSISASISGTSLQWSATGDDSAIDHFVPYISTDGKSLMALPEVYSASGSLNLCSFSFPDGTYTLYVQAVGKPSMTNRISSGVRATLSCGSSSGGSGSGGDSGSGSGGLTLAASTSSLTIGSGGSGTLTVSVAPKSGSFDSAVYLSCSGLPSTLKCSFAPSSVIPGSGSASSLLTIVAASSGTANYYPRQTFFLANWIFGLGLFGFFLAGKFDGRGLIRTLGACILAATIIGAVSCGGNRTISAGSTASVSRYVITIDGTAGTTKLSTTVAVTVQ
jgi:hypothetical protein